MGIFDSIKDLHALRQQAQAVQQQLASVRIEGIAKNNFKIVINGNQDVLDVVIPHNIDRDAFPQSIKDAFADAQAKLKKLMQEKMLG